MLGPVSHDGYIWANSDRQVKQTNKQNKKIVFITVKVRIIVHITFDGFIHSFIHSLVSVIRSFVRPSRTSSNVQSLIPSFVSLFYIYIYYSFRRCDPITLLIKLLICL